MKFSVCSKIPASFPLLDNACLNPYQDRFSPAARLRSNIEQTETTAKRSLGAKLCLPETKAAKRPRAQPRGARARSATRQRVHDTCMHVHTYKKPTLPQHNLPTYGVYLVDDAPEVKATRCRTIF